MINLSIAIMAHRKRERHIPYLLERLPEGTPVIWDQHNDRWDTGRRSMLAYGADATHHLVIQDDAILCRDLAEGLERALTFMPSNPISLYTGKVRPNHAYVANMVAQAQRTGRHWISMQGPWWGVGVCVPVEHIGPMIAFGDQRPDIANYDLRMSRYFDAIELECLYTVPSLVTHRVGPDEPSLVPGRGHGASRTAFRFIGEDASASSVEWGGDTVRAHPWRRGVYAGAPHWWCMACPFDAASERGVRNHYVKQHQGAFPGPLDFVATTPESIEAMQSAWSALPSAMRGKFYVMPREYGDLATVAHETMRRVELAEHLRHTDDRLVVVAQERDLEYIGGRMGLVFPEGTPEHAAQWLARHTYLASLAVAG